MAQPLYQITNQTVVGGHGMVAALKILKGTVILEEDPLVVIDTNITRVHWAQGQTATNFYASEGAGTTRRIAAAFGHNRWRNNQLALRALAHHAAQNNPPPVQRIVDASIVESNAFGFGNPVRINNNQFNNNEWLVFYNDISRINHSCVPNARTSDIIDAIPNPNLLGRMKVIATKDIEAGDEIMIEYLTDRNFWLQPHATRRAILQANWHFLCQCDACHTTSGLFADHIWEFARRLNAEIYLPHPVNHPYVFSRRIHAAEMYISILNFYGFGDGRLSRA
jgi:hypothetical protein